MKVYVMEFFGDLPMKGAVGPKAFNTLNQALSYVKENFNSGSRYDEGDNENKGIWLDPEDDRILIWEVMAGFPKEEPDVKICWHFSGWHWDSTAADLPGGPLDQGKLVGDEESLYVQCFEDY